MDRLTSIGIFSRVVTAGSFTTAARQLEISPAAVSKHIQALEDWLGAQLLNRTTRRISLTEFGTTFHRESGHLLDELERLRNEATSHKLVPRGRLRVAAPVSFGVLHLAAAVADYQAAYPSVDIDIELSDKVVNLIEEGFDVGIRIGNLRDSTLIARRIADNRFVLCAAPAYIEAKGAPDHPDELTRHACLEYSYSSAPGSWIFESPTGDEITVNVQGRLRANNGEFLTGAALKGLGIMLAPDFIARPHLAAGSLVPVLAHFVPRRSAIHAVYPANRHLSSKVRTFIDFLAGRFSEEFSE
ncbi:MAG TPA: LysR family transcriptional regulator [Solimonas sp.]|nr:LysR family transcriptional regulator [Solimonas sp.]